MLLHIVAGISIYAAPLSPPMPGSRHDLEAERALVRSLIAEAYAPAAAPTLTHHPSGAPALEATTASISITHSRAMAAVAIDPKGRPLGIDTDTTDRTRTLHRVAQRYLSAAQMVEWAASPHLLLLAWTLKEALYKAALTPGVELSELPLPPPSFATEGHAQVYWRGHAYTLHLLPSIAECGPITLAVREEAQ